MRTNSLTDSMQAVVNQRLWKFIEQHGGVRTVATKLGVVPQTLYNMRDNRSFPSAGTLALIKQQYPQTNINYFVSADEVAQADEDPTEPTDSLLADEVDSDESDLERTYTVEFIKKRGTEQVARETGLNRQTLRQIVNGRNGPGRKVIAALTATYPEYDIKQPLFGTEIYRQPIAEVSVNNNRSLGDVIAENERLRLEIEYMRRERDKSEQEKAQYWKLLETMHDRKQDFSAVSSQSTELLFELPEPQRVRVDGFQWYQQVNEKKPVTRTWDIEQYVNIWDAIEV